MPYCELFDVCPFYNDEIDQHYSASIAAMRKRYCKKDNSKCARYNVFKALGRNRVPIDLFPNDEKRALVILS